MIADMLAFTAQHGPALAIIVPLIASPLIVLLSYRSVAFAVAWLATLISFIVSVQMLLTTRDGTVLSYALGGWAPPIGIEYRVDAANAIVLVIISALGSALMPYLRGLIDAEVRASQQTLFYACLMLCFTGLMGVTITGDAFNVFVFLEISSLSTYVLVAMGANSDKRALSAAYDYLILGTIGATFFVIGLGLIYIATGTLNLVDLAVRLQDVGDNRTVRTAYGFIVVGLALKIAMVPLHRWLPGAYTFAPTAISVFLASTSTKVAIYVLARFVFSVFGVDADFEKDTLQFVIMPLALIAMFAMSIVAVFQKNTKRLLAYSSLGQIGYMLLGLTFLSVTGLAATFTHLFAHALTKGALFMAVGAIAMRAGGPMLSGLAGAGRSMPWTSAALVVGGLSLIGVPGTVGFVSKWVLMQGAFEAGLWPIGFAIVGSSIIAVVYVWRLVEVMYFEAPKPELREAPWPLLAPIWLLTAAMIWFGFNGEFIVGAATAAGESLLNGGYIAPDATIIGVPGR
ncbi:MAG: monovalent cation/H+ antiporter subunit D family protein [Pseudomonadota bacterium]